MSYRYKLQPQTPARRIGIEIEFSPYEPFSSEKDRSDKTFCKIPGLIGLSKFMEVDWEHITYAHDNMYGYEATMLFQANAWKSKLDKALKAIRHSGGVVDERCGLHVHIDFRHDPDGRYAACDRLFAASASLWDLCDPSRRLNPECKQPIPGEYDRKDRAFWIAEKYQTVEVRMKEATLDFQEAKKWIEAVQKVVG